MEFMNTRGGQEFTSKVPIYLKSISNSLESIAKSLEILAKNQKETNDEASASRD